jgi:hypothetical protein
MLLWSKISLSYLLSIIYLSFDHLLFEICFAASLLIVDDAKYLHIYIDIYTQVKVNLT